MTKRILIPLILLIIQLHVYAQSDTLTINSAYLAGEKMLNAFHAQNLDEFLNYLHPRIIEENGGREKLKEMFKAGLGPDVKFISATLKKPNAIITHDKTMQCSMEQTQVLETKGKKYYSLSTLIGLSPDQGKTWYFISGSENSLAELKKKFPELSNELPYTAQSPPVLIEK